MLSSNYWAPCVVCILRPDSLHLLTSLPGRMFTANPNLKSSKRTEPRQNYTGPKPPASAYTPVQPKARAPPKTKPTASAPNGK